MAKFSESNAIVYGTIIAADNYNAGWTGDSVCMGKYNHGTMIIVGDAAVAGAGSLTMMAGAAAGNVTAAITFEYRSVTTDILSATADVLSAPGSTSAALALTEANILSGMYVIEWDADDLNVSGTQYNWITPVLSAAGTAGIVTAIIILSEPRYSKAVMPTVVA
jgi:hypothetical protein